MRFLGDAAELHAIGPFERRSSDRSPLHAATTCRQTPGLTWPDGQRRHAVAAPDQRIFLRIFEPRELRRVTVRTPGWDLHRAQGYRGQPLSAARAHDVDQVVSSRTCVSVEPYGGVERPASCAEERPSRRASSWSTRTRKAGARLHPVEMGMGGAGRGREAAPVLRISRTRSHRGRPRGIEGPATGGPSLERIDPRHPGEAYGQQARAADAAAPPRQVLGDDHRLGDEGSAAARSAAVEADGAAPD